MATRTTTKEAPKKKPIAEATRRRNIQGALWQHSKEGNSYYVVGLTRSVSSGALEPATDGRDKTDR